MNNIRLIATLIRISEDMAVFLCSEAISLCCALKFMLSFKVHLCD